MRVHIRIAMTGKMLPARHNSSVMQALNIRQAITADFIRRNGKAAVAANGIVGIRKAVQNRRKVAKRRAETAETGLNPDNWDDVAVIFRRYSNITPAYIEAVEQTFDLYKQIID